MTRFDLDRLISELEDSFASWCNSPAADEPEPMNRLRAAREALRKAFTLESAALLAIHEHLNVLISLEPHNAKIELANLMAYDARKALSHLETILQPRSTPRCSNPREMPVAPSSSL